MKRGRWKAGRSYRRRFWTRGWWFGFLWGLLLVLLVKAAVHYLAPSAQAEGRDTAGMQESAPAQADGIESGTTPPAGEEAGSPSKGDIPAASGLGAGGAADADKQLSAYDKLRVSVYLTKEKRIEKIPIELYVRGVLAGEMPVDFELEALKAQAIAARTYIYRRLLTGDRSGLTEKESAADVDDTVLNQVYISLGDLLNRWSGSAKDANLQKLNDAVEATKGQIVTYGGEPIQASFFSTSNGYTENASDYWDVDLPYLRSVASPWDKAISPNYQEKMTMKLKDVAAKLGVKASEVRNMRILDRTSGSRVKGVKVGGETFTGREIREKLSLASSDFTWTIDGDEINLLTRGYGHGVGLSQWGADGMAKDGATARQILAHYYSGTRIEQASGVLD
ncbi:stage II sporulation protein D [Paenibacillus sacheonensis]|uniref:Stage II sporulation protein D n=1 Tax=Paenibacillus sacheonensis TaxID=742054 RepID=A0A7X4YVU9_9BACL|nr:stage II sporulation protein D [Paenibacillus sacheonensis]MBM7566511.1 stage II sporulation protein D [Paenibacillus sacheonensis]NBC73480.1 stage II sporulation protein D [Paenibacillus sacheonensis]